MRIAWLAVFATCLSRAVGGLANAGAASSDTTGSASRTCVSVSHVTETAALRTLTTTLTIHANHTRFNATGVRNGIGSRIGAHSTQGHASLPILTTSSSDALVCPPASASAPCPCYSIVRSTTTVTVPKKTITSTTMAFTNGTRLPWHLTSRTQTATGASSASQETISSATAALSSFLLTGNSAGAPFLSTSTAAGASRKPSVVYVVNSTTTLITITTSSSKGSGSISNIPSSDTTTGRYIHPLSTQGNSSRTTARPPFPRNSTSTKLFLNATSAARLNSSIPSLLATNTTRPVWLNTSSAAITARITNKPWLNFSTFPGARTNTSLPIWLNTSLPRVNATITTAPPRWLNTSSTATSAAPTSSATTTPGCNITTASGASKFNLQVSQPGGTFNNWFLRTSGIGLLFTRQSAQASAFGLGGAGELCALGLVDDEGVPYLAVVESRNVTNSSSVALGGASAGGTVIGGGGSVGETGSGSGGNGGSVWLVAKSTLQALRDDYTALRCEKGSGGGLSCRGEDGEARDAQYWLGCGMQLDLSSDPSGEGPGRGLNCSAVGLGVVQG